MNSKWLRPLTSQKSIDSGKVPPQALEFEEAVIGALLLEAGVLDRIPLLRPEHFYSETHQEIFRAALDLAKNNYPIDLITVQEQLSKTGKLDAAGGFYALAKVTSKVSSGANVEYHCAVIFEKYNLREIIRTSTQAIEKAYESGADPFEIQAVVNADLEKTQFSTSREPVRMLDIARENFKLIDKIAESGKHITGIDSGYSNINEITRGFHGPDLTILAARPSTGKTALALNLADNIARQGIPVGFFSLEMSAKQLMNRLISIGANLPAIKLKAAKLTPDDWENIHQHNWDLPIFIDDTPGLNILEFKAKARKLKKKHGIKIIFIDYLQLMESSGKHSNQSREQYVSTISRTLKLVAKELDLPVVALAQLSRDVEKRNGPPRLSDLRESGSLEQDADIVAFLHNENAGDKSIDDVPIELIYAKHRDGPCLSTELKFHKPTQKFRS